MLFADIFSQSIACIFFLQGLLQSKRVFDEVQFIGSSFLGASKCKSLCLALHPENFCLSFVSRRFVFLHFAFKSVMHFDLIALKAMRLVLVYSFYLWMSTCTSTVCWKSSFFQWIAFTLLSKIGWTYLCGLFLVSLLCSINLRLNILPPPHGLDYCNYVLSLEIR